MKQAHRVYLRYKYRNDHQSSSFRSNVERSTIDYNTPNVNEVGPGPGSYEITLPLVKPKYQAIVKNNRSIIIKVNEGFAPPFYTREERFKEKSTIQSKTDRKSIDLKEIDQQIFAKIRSHNVYQPKIFKEKNHNSEKVSSSIASLINKNYSEKNNEKPKLKGSIWSRYKEERRLWTNSNSEIPGPGSYETLRKKTIEMSKNSSWQFKSHVKRGFKSLHSSVQSVEMPEIEHKINAIHSRQNIKLLQYQ